MEILNNVILIGIFLSSLVNLIIEMDETKSTKYIIIAKVLFCFMAIGSILAVSKPQIGNFILYSSILSGLIIRIIRNINRKKKENDNNIDIR